MSPRRQAGETVAIFEHQLLDVQLRRPRHNRMRVLGDILRSTDGAASVRPILDPAMLLAIDAASSPPSSPPPPVRDDSTHGPMELSPHRYRAVRACVLSMHVLSLVYFVCFAYASYSTSSTSDPSSSLPAPIIPTATSGIVLLAHVIAATLHVVRVKALVTAAFFHRAEYIPTKRPRAFYDRIFAWLSFHKLLVVVSHSYHGLLLYSFVQTRQLVLIYLVVVWIYALLAFPCFVLKRILPKAHLRLASLACSLALDAVPGVSLRIWWMFACDDPISQLDATDFTTGVASALPPLLLLSALSSLSALVTKFKPARSPQKVRRVTHGPSSPLRFDFTEPTKEPKLCCSGHRVGAVGSVVWASVAVALAIHALHSHPPDVVRCVLVLRRPFSAVPLVCRSFELHCDNMAAQSLLDLPLPATSLAALKFVNCPSLALDTFESTPWSALARIELVNTTVTAAGSAVYPSLLHVVLRRSILSEDVPALLPPSLMSLQVTSSRLFDDVLPPLPQLRTLDVRNTPLRSFDGAAMPRLVHAAVLYAQLAAIDPWPAMNLVDLWLSGNPIASIPDEILSLPRLQLLVVDHTKLERIGDRVSTSLLRIIATDTPLCRRIADFLSHAQIQYTHGDASLVQC